MNSKTAVCLMTTVFTAGWMAIGGVVRAAVITVPGDYPTIQQAIDAAAEGDQVVVSPGRYQENVHFSNKNIVLRSTDPTSPTVVFQTIIDANQSGAGVTFGGKEGPACRISGFRITNATDGYYGWKDTDGAVFGNFSQATVENNQITTNTTAGISSCKGLIRNNTVAYNWFGIRDCDGRIEHNVICGNSSDSYGGGLVDCQGEIIGNFICNNEAGSTYAGVQFCNGTIQDNTIAGNRSPLGSVGYCSGSIRNCIIWGSTPGDAAQFVSSSVPVACCIQGMDARWEGFGNFSKDPRFRDPAHGDYHLLPDSPCIDSGIETDVEATDIDGDPRLLKTYSVDLLGSNMDIGADEFAGQPSTAPPLPAPTDLVPNKESSAVWIQPHLSCSASESSQSLTYHLATQWQVAEDSGFTSPVYDSKTDPVHLTVLDLPAELQPQHHYFWRVRFLNGARRWGEWSASELTTYAGQVVRVPEDFPTIQAALDSSSAGTEIRVDEGTYPEQITFRGPDVILRSTNPSNWEVIKHTIIGIEFDPGLTWKTTGSTVKFSGQEQSSCILEGFTIVGGAEDYDYIGGGIRGHGTHATIRRNWIRDNRVLGHAISHFSWAEVHNAYGGGIVECDGLIEGNVISGTRGYDDTTNYTNFEGCCGPVPAYATAVGNGYAIYDCLGPIFNDTLYDNDYGIISSAGPFRNTIIWKTADSPLSSLFSLPAYCCIEGYDGPGTATLTADPELVDPDNGDFHLRFYSPCIDAGGVVQGVNLDFDGDPRPHSSSWSNRGDGSGFDIGADEYPAGRGLPPEFVDKKILGMFPEYDGVDLNGDGIVDIADWITYLRSANP